MTKLERLAALLAVLLTAACAACTAEPAPPAPTRSQLKPPSLINDDRLPEGVQMMVHAVPDALTVELADNVRVRIALLAPPADCWAREALAFARTTLLASPVRVTSVTPGEVSLTLEDGTDYALLAVREGMLRTQGADGGRYTEAEMAAADANRGLWGPPCEGLDNEVPPPPPPKPVQPKPVPPKPVTTTTPPPPPPPAPTTTTRPPPAPPCAVSYRTTGDWPNGFQANVTVRNTSATAINGWTLQWTFTRGQTVTQMWNAASTQNRGTVRATNVHYTASIPPGGSVQIGFNGNKPGANPAPTAFSLNDKTCTVE